MGNIVYHASLSECDELLLNAHFPEIVSDVVIL